MLGLILAVAGFAALIAAVEYLVILAMDWMVNRVKEKLRKRNTQKVAVGDLEKIIESCDNQIAIDELEKLTEEKGATHIFAEVDYNGNVSNVEAVGAEDVDSNVDSFINRTGEGMVVVSA